MPIHKPSIALFLAASLTFACGGRVPADDTPADTGIGGDADPTDGDLVDETGQPPDGAPVEAGADAAKPTAATCEKYVAATCTTTTQACCTTAGHTWNSAACTTNMDYYCNALVDQVTLGRATFDGSYLDACLAGWTSNLTQCEVNGVTSAKNLIPCTQLFNGTKKVGESCTGTAFVECEAPPGFGAYCDTSSGSGVCRAYGFVGKDQPCNYYGSTVRYCDDGLYCDVTSPTTTCKTAKALGADCAGPSDFSCGLSALCKSGKCTARLGEGATCSDDQECASFACTESKCTKPTAPAASKWMCSGAD